MIGSLVYLCTYVSIIHSVIGRMMKTNERAELYAKTFLGKYPLWCLKVKGVISLHVEGEFLGVES